MVPKLAAVQQGHAVFYVVEIIFPDLQAVAQDPGIGRIHRYLDRRGHSDLFQSPDHFFGQRIFGGNEIGLKLMFFQFGQYDVPVLMKEDFAADQVDILQTDLGGFANQREDALRRQLSAGSRLSVGITVFASGHAFVREHEREPQGHRVYPPFLRIHRELTDEFFYGQISERVGSLPDFFLIDEYLTGKPDRGAVPLAFQRLLVFNKLRQKRPDRIGVLIQKIRNLAEILLESSVVRKKRQDHRLDRMDKTGPQGHFANRLPLAV